jgi:hypothetical protein
MVALGIQNAPVSFVTLVGVERARLDGDRVVGKFGELREKTIANPRRFCADFANHRDDPDSILKFTQELGPLDCPTATGESFEFKLDDWRSFHDSFRNFWTALANVPATAIDSGSVVPTRADEAVLFSEHGIRYRAKLGRVLTFAFATIPIHSLRICAKPDCGRFFVAWHPKEKHCSAPCKAWAEREANLRCWHKNKAKYEKHKKRAEQQRQTKGAHNAKRHSRKNQ